MLSNFHPSKKLGQNFLKDLNILNKILKSLSLTKEDIVLEIGAGKGILTKAIANHAKKVIAVEVDRRLCEFLEGELKDRDNISLIKKDILEFDLGDYLKKQELNKKIIIVGNIPYSITSSIIDYVFKNIDIVDSIYLMVQKEVAERIVAKPNTKEYSSLSCFTQYYAEPRMLFLIKRTCFWPVPEVNSYFIELSPIKRDAMPEALRPNDERLLFRMIRTCFNQRRKTMLNGLSRISNKDKAKKTLISLGISENARAENISLREFIALSNKLNDAKG